MMQGSGYYQRDKTRWRTYCTVREIIQRTLAVIPWHSFAARNKLFFLMFVFCFVEFFSPANKYPYKSVLNIFSTSVTCNFLDLVRKWYHNPDDSTDIIFRLLLSVLPFSLISSCVVHDQLWHLFFAAQF